MTEDLRHIALKNGLRQLTNEQIERVLKTPSDQICLDDGNFINGKFCPLAIALDLPAIIKEPTDDKVHAVLTMLGYKVNNTRGVVGNFYTTNRLQDLVHAALDVLEERMK